MAFITRVASHQGDSAPRSANHITLPRGFPRPSPLGKAPPFGSYAFFPHFEVGFWDNPPSKSWSVGYSPLGCPKIRTLEVIYKVFGALEQSEPN